MAEQVIVVDANVLRVLFNSSGTVGLDSLLVAGQRIVLLQEIKTEFLQGTPEALRPEFTDWIQRNSSRIVVPELTGVPPGEHWGDLAFRSFSAANVDTSRTRFLTNDGGAFNYETRDGIGGRGSSDPAELRTPGQYARPYMGIFEFFKEQVALGSLSPTTASNITEAIKADPNLWSSLPSEIHNRAFPATIYDCRRVRWLG